MKAQALLESAERRRRVDRHANMAKKSALAVRRSRCRGPSTLQSGGEHLFPGGDGAFRRVAGLIDKLLA
jgi:hypothetical protein